jgi:hypothetical protein
MKSKDPTNVTIYLATFLASLAFANLSYSAHCVLVEGCSTRSCPHCAAAAAEMYDLHGSGLYDFCYVALVAHMTEAATERCRELGADFVPLYTFDGGYDEWLGSGGLPDAYTSRLTTCSEREVADLDIDVEVTWEMDALMGVNVSLENNMAEAYRGHLRTYVTEIESRWNTAAGEPFHFAMIGDYAFNKAIEIPAGETVRESTMWDGMFQGFEDIQRDNIMVIAAVFDETTGHVDESAAAPVSLDDPGAGFRRGDANADGRLDVSDAVFTLNYLFAGGAAPPCQDAADADDNGDLQITDAVRTLGYLFLSGAAPESPFPDCGADPGGGDLGCESFPPCAGAE